MRRALLAVLLLALPASAAGQKVFLNPSNQFTNAVTGGGNEADFAKTCADLAAAKLVAAGYQVVVDQDFTNAPANANDWPADVFVSMHTNAGGGHGTETLHHTSATAASKTLAQNVQSALVSSLKFRNRGLTPRSNLHVLNDTVVPACLEEALFHDCVTTAGQIGHPPAEAPHLRTAAGREQIAEGVANGVCRHFTGNSCGVVVPKGWIKGVVYQNGNTLDRVAGATVTLSSGESTLYSGSGIWEFEIPPGTYSVTASAPGYVTRTLTGVTVVATQTTWASVGLQAQSGADAGAPGPDASAPDAAPAGEDAATIGEDAASGDDAAMGEDAAVGEDAATAGDATSPEDAAAPAVDAAIGEGIDAAPEGADAGPAADAGAGVPDGAEPGDSGGAVALVDAARLPDASPSVRSDATEAPAPTDAAWDDGVVARGCGCQSAPGSLALALLTLMPLASRRRKP